MQVPFTLSNESLSVFAEGKMHTIRSSHANFEKVVDLLKQPQHDESAIAQACDVESFVRDATSSNQKVEVKYGAVYFEGSPIHNTLTDKLLELLEAGFDVTPWVNFLENLMENPSYRSREALYDFLEHFSAPLTEDGCFIAFKRVRGNFKDIHTGKFDNSPGQVLTMPRSQVDDDNQRTCSAGLHVCADEYLTGFANHSDNKTVVVKVNPRDVVSVPYDYNFSKMRTCGYEVLREIEPKDVEYVQGQTFYGDYDENFMDPDEMDEFGDFY